MGSSSIIKDTLKGICRNNRWSYGVFWAFHRQNSMLLTLEDICYDEEEEQQQVGMVATHLLQQVFMLGEGVIGMAAFTGKHRWVFSDSYMGEWISSMFLGSSSQGISHQDNSEFQQQFSCGIKTVAVIPVHPHGVIQLGSTQKIFESLGFLVDIKRLISQVITNGGLVSMTSPPIPSSTDICNYDDWSAKLNMGKSCCSFDMPGLDLSFLSKSSCETSVLTSFEPEPLPTFDSRDQDAQYPNYLDMDFLESVGGNSTFTPVSSETSFLSMEIIQQLAQDEPLPVAEGEFFSSVTNIPDFNEEYLSGDFPDLSFVDDLFQWFPSSPKNTTNGVTAELDLGDSLSQAVGGQVSDSNQVEVEKFLDNPSKIEPLVGVSTDVSHSHSDEQDKAKAATAVVLQNDRDEQRLFDSLGLDFGCGSVPVVSKSQEISMTEAYGSHLSPFSSKLADAVDSSSDLIPRKRKRLFWELGIEQLLDGLSNTSSANMSGVENQSSTSKGSKTERWSVNSNLVELAAPCTSTNMTQRSSSCSREWNLQCRKQVSSQIDDSFSTNIGGAIREHSESQKGEEDPTRISKKIRARPGESNRPRPKDRQQIQDRIKELRGIIPNGAKCSIDSLLDRTIKYMIFLQSVTKYAERLKEVNKPKLIKQENGVILDDKCTGDGGGGVTWAFNVGGATPMVCPVIVEDLNSPGQMLVEMLCEERGFFLEIADMIRSYGLTILKGVMEIREDKIWAQFVVEVKLNTNQSITRINVFLLLMELLQETKELDSEWRGNGSGGGGVPMNPTLQIPLSLAEALH